MDAKVSKDLYEGGNYYISKTAQTHPVTTCVYDYGAALCNVDTLQTDFVSVFTVWWLHFTREVGKKGSLHFITESRVPELIPVLGSQPASDVSHKPDGRLPLFYTRPAITLATI